MTTLYYVIFFLVGMIYELRGLTSPGELLEERKTLKDYRARKKEGNVEDVPDPFWFSFIYFILLLIGIVTSQWPVFVLIILLGFIPKSNKFIIIVDSFITMLLVLFIILNKFHLQIDLTQLVLNQFS